MQLTLTVATITSHHYLVGSTPIGVAFIGRADGPANEWQTFFPAATARVVPTANQAAIRALTAYLTGKQTTFTCPLDVSYGTPFQQQVWQALRTIPYGQTWSYTQLAHSLNRPTAVRAIASAVGRNPLLIFVPCHRVIRQDGQLGGYRGGLPMKRALLALEKRPS
ncbi:methylated-DNA--[protein]-cysteine S-methyltransferase [Lactobacillus sp. CBA3606]|uniref:methylated-DNA--[protein]-cysteine S-methyltransferase n=1 Tax=Lactobacillus sp. CBA3606 TaxID=2099789 RepID=UPI000CFC9888|nr:methylated-DNA--[protein]-cysteine S-methyltransferase [Lactobacillus sp. CBA3606]AVK63667.1 methylated-DNA--[protein]-cysteine S-methyltransferase [Lactobacillus sp. CBA3606]